MRLCEGDRQQGDHYQAETGQPHHNDDRSVQGDAQDHGKHAHFVRAEGTCGQHQLNADYRPGERTDDPRRFQQRAERLPRAGRQAVDRVEEYIVNRAAVRPGFVHQLRQCHTGVDDADLQTNGHHCGEREPTPGRSERPRRCCPLPATAIAEAQRDREQRGDLRDAVSAIGHGHADREPE